jgi:cytoskeletal protein CcmA (bactofilin family)
MNISTPKPPVGSPIPGAAMKTDVPRRVVDLPGAAPRPGFGAPTPTASTPATPAAAPAAPAVPASQSVDQRRLIVGRDISLSGEIGSCDVLVVEGTVEAKLRDGRSIEIAESGLFKGSVEIDEADIGGRFEGDISVRGRLTVRSTGKITGSIKYGELAVEAGGQLIGDIQVMGAAKPAAPATPADKPAVAAGTP